MLYPRRFHGWRALVGLLAGFAFPYPASPALAAESDKLAPVTIAGGETFDVFAVPVGVQSGTALLNKLQVSVTVRGDQLGFRGWDFHAQIIRFDGQSLSRRMGDIQTADNIEAPRVTRLFEAYVSKLWSDDRSSIAVRGGLIDLNSQFDSIDAASLMLNSSHGIAPDLSRSGRNGPSIYPVTAVGSTVTWVQSDQWTFRLGLFDGVAGSPTHPEAFLAERLRPSDGVLLIGQADWQLNKNSRIEGGAWGYSAGQPGPAGGRAHDHGAYLSYEAPFKLLPHLDFWLRAGVANEQAQTIAGYLGGGLVQRGTFAGRPDDRLALAVAHAIIGPPAREVLMLPNAETSVELTYQARISRRFVVQPDVDYVRHPAGTARAPNSLGLGLRFVFVAAYPVRMAASDPGDPTVPPDVSPPQSDDSPGE